MKDARCLPVFDFWIRNKQYFSRSTSHETCGTCLYIKMSVSDLKFKFICTLYFVW